MYAFSYYPYSPNYIPYIPTSIQLLFIKYYIEFDSFGGNGLIQNQNLTAIGRGIRYGQVSMSGKQLHNVIYQWDFVINSSRDHSISLGIVDTSYVTRVSNYSQYSDMQLNSVLHHIFENHYPFNAYYRFYNDEMLGVKYEYYRYCTVFDEGDTIRLQIIFDSNCETQTMKIINPTNNKVYLYKHNINLNIQTSYKLLVVIKGDAEIITLKGFKTICDESCGLI